MLQRDLAGQYENWQVVKTKGQEDIDVSEEKATDAESTSVLWLQSSCVFGFVAFLPENCRFLWNQYASLMLCAHATGLKVKRSQTHRESKSAKAPQPRFPPLQRRAQRRTKLSPCLFCIEDLVAFYSLQQVVDLFQKHWSVGS